MARQNHKTVTSAAPIGGLNVSDSLVSMPPTDATVVRNWFSQPYGMEVRRGYVRHATGLGAEVDTLMEHIPATAGLGKLYAFAGANMYDVTAPGDQVRVPVVSGLTNSIWNTIGIANAGGQNSVAYNGFDNGIWVRDNGTITRISLAVNPLSPTADEIAGVDPKLLISGCIHQKRMWLVQKNTLKAWYLAPEAVTGQAQQFDFGSVFTRGGRLIQVASWTLDSGIGPDDLLVAITSLGEIAIYTGTDPSSVTTWQLKGIFYTGAPLGRRALVSVAGDLLVLTQFGLLSMNAAMQTSDTAAADGNQYLSQKIQYLISVLASDLIDEIGWDLINWPDTNMLLINVPIIGEHGQLVQSTITKGWSQWDNMDANCWLVAGRYLIFGGVDGSVYRAWEGYTDKAIQSDATTITRGEPISAQLQTAFNYYGGMSVIKHAKMVRPVFLNSALVKYNIKANPDFNYDQPLDAGAANSASGALWNRGLWNQDSWAGGLRTQKLWTSVSGIGAAFAISIALETENPVLWAAYDFIYEEGTGI